MCGIVLISLCPVSISLYIYYSLCRRIKSIKKVCRDLEGISCLLYIKSGEFQPFDYDFLNKSEIAVLNNFYNSLTSSNSSLITNECSRLKNEFNNIEKIENDNLLQKGKIVLSFGICIGITIFILLI